MYILMSTMKEVREDLDWGFQTGWFTLSVESDLRVEVDNYISRIEKKFSDEDSYEVYCCAMILELQEKVHV